MPLGSDYRDVYLPTGLKDVLVEPILLLTYRSATYFDYIASSARIAPAAPNPPFTPLPTHILTVTAGEGGSVDPAGTTTHRDGSEVTLTATWNDATHTFAGWSGDCSGTATTCVLTIYANKTVTAAFTPLPPNRCATPTHPTCIRAVYKGAPARLRPRPGHPRRHAPHSSPTTTAATRSSAASRSPSSPPLSSPPATPASICSGQPLQVRRQSHLVRATDPAGRHDIHLHARLSLRAQPSELTFNLRPPPASRPLADRPVPETGTRPT